MAKRANEQIKFPKKGEANAIDYLKNTLKPYIEKYLGDWEKAHLNLPATNGILINGIPMTYYIKEITKGDVTKENDIFYTTLGKAIVENANITILPRDPMTGKTMDAPVDLTFSMSKADKTSLADSLKDTPLTHKVSAHGSPLGKTEKDIIKNLQKMDKLLLSPGVQTMTDINHHHLLRAYDITASIFGEQFANYPKRGSTQSIHGTLIPVKGSFRFPRSGLSLGVAYLLSKGLTFDEILDPSVKAEEKKRYGAELLALSETGEEGKKTMALICVDTMQKLKSEPRRPATPHAYDWVANFHDYLANKILFDLSQEVSPLDLNSLYESELRSENQANGSNKSDKEIKQEAKEKYHQVINLNGFSGLATTSMNTMLYPDQKDLGVWAQNYLAHRQILQEKHADLYKTNEADIASFSENALISFNMEVNASAEYYRAMASIAGKTPLDILVDSGIIDNPEANVKETYTNYAFRSFEDVMVTLNTLLDKADPSYIRSSQEYKNMKASVKTALEAFKDAPAKLTAGRREALMKVCTKALQATESYLDLKADINPKKGSNAYIRLEAANYVYDKLSKYTDALTRNVIAPDRKKDAEQIARFNKHYIELASPRSDEPRGPLKKDRAMNLSLDCKKPEHDYTLPENGTITEKDAALLTLVNVASYRIASNYEAAGREKGAITTCQTAINVLLEDIFTERIGYDRDKMPLIELSRADMKERIEAYKAGNKKPLATVLAEGLKDFQLAFALSGKGLMSPKNFCSLKVASEVYNMLMRNQDLVELACSEEMGENRLTPEILENYRAANVTYEVYSKAENAKEMLINLKASDLKKPGTINNVKEALADLILRHMLSKQCITEYEKIAQDIHAKSVKEDNDLIEKYGLNSQEYNKASVEANLKRQSEYYEKPILDAQKGFTKKPYSQMKQQLMNDPHINSLASHMTTHDISYILANETTYFENLTSTLIQNKNLQLNMNQPNLNQEQPNMHI